MQFLCDILLGRGAVVGSFYDHSCLLEIVEPRSSTLEVDRYVGVSTFKKPKA